MTQLKFLNRLFTGEKLPNKPIRFPDPPPWRSFAKPNTATAEAWQQKAAHYIADEKQINAVNIALHLHRPLLVTGTPGTGKSSLASAVAYQLGLDRPLVWAINSKSTLKDGLYQFDAVAHFQSKKNQSVAEFIKLGPLGAALALSDQAKPIVLLIDELDKGDFDLPNDLLHALDEGRFEIPELQRVGGTCFVAVPQSTEKVPVADGVVQCRYFPIVVMTSNGEREFPPAFMRRCIPLHIESPSAEALKEIIVKRINPKNLANYNELIESFATRSKEKGVTLAIDQLLNAIQLMEQKHLPVDKRAAEQLRIIENLEAN